MATAELSPAELNALLEQSAIEDPTASDAAAEPLAVPPAETRQADLQLGRQPRIIRTPLPGLDAIHETFAGYLQSALAQFTGQTCGISAAAAKTETYDAFIARQPVPASLNVLAIKPLYGHALLVLQPQLLFALIDALFGGSGRFPAHLEGRGFSASEQRVINRLTGHFCAEYARAWQPSYPIELTPTLSEMRPADVAIVGSSEMMISFDLSVTIGAASGVLSLCIACAALEPIRDKLHGIANALPREPSDQRRVDTLADQIKGVSVELVAELAQGQMTVAELLALKVGDFVEFDLRECLLVKIGTVPLLRCGYGVASGRYALRVQELLTNKTTQQGESYHVQ